MSKNSTLFYFLDTYFEGAQSEVVEFITSVFEEEKEVTDLLEYLNAFEADVDDSVVEELLAFALKYQEEKRTLT